MRFRWIAAITAAAALGAAAQHHAHDHDGGFGKPADPKKAARTIAIEMADTMRYMPDRVEVKRGDAVLFAVKNAGKLEHEMVLGTKKELVEHAEMMRAMAGMHHDHGGPNMLHLAPGKSGEIAWQFTEPGEFYYGCFEPGHFEAGMVGKVIVR